MQREPYENRDGFRVTLSEKEHKLVWNKAEGENKAAAGLAAYRGLRIGEIVPARVDDFEHRGEASWYLNVREEGAKRDKWRATPIPEKVKIQCEAVADDGIISSTKRTFQRRLNDITADLAEETGNDAWEYVGYHDLRRTRAMTMLNHTDAHLMVMSFGGWDDWRTFRDNYLGEHSIEAQARERDNVPWL